MQTKFNYSDLKYKYSKGTAADSLYISDLMWELRAFAAFHSIHYVENGVIIGQDCKNEIRFSFQEIIEYGKYHSSFFILFRDGSVLLLSYLNKRRKTISINNHNRCYVYFILWIFYTRCMLFP
ncbi:hypothetical protein [Parabacteroides sp. AM08-6]|uniref:hypothetical protein n=1 Tax=Parabacteroides sp. AM08-6 TaxID=2292053 RepID=UPI000F00BF62|nr:hypothetical protein [Parabacteroides sp. AM08-6]RHJ81893.1 hypothetical protein DW103_10500 [Parabacteroides sp. AM08-6]